MSRTLPVSESRLAREFLLALQRARAAKDNITVRWPGASAEDISLVSAFLDADIHYLIGTGIEELKGMK